MDLRRNSSSIERVLHGLLSRLGGYRRTAWVYEREQSFFYGCDYMRSDKLRSKLIRELGRLFQDFVCLPIQSNRTHDSLQLQPLLGMDSFIEVRTRQNRTVRVVQYFRSYGP